MLNGVLSSSTTQLFLSLSFRGNGGLVSASGPQGSRLETRFRCVCGPLHVKSYVVVKRPQVGVTWKFGEGCQLRCRPRHLTAVQNYEVRPKIALVLFENGALI
ncbi:hypothetical protein AVEN_90487-1 [Araneus ventricosus]|uniref:Uncharacterized protein n=1 Tax=Araneus ventricosus TaxID=182803 RepID=A0A4Y2AKN5_ARAVE|nr:hypothetical protein AVEN_90487-1 [Araneus ventricosus]